MYAWWDVFLPSVAAFTSLSNACMPNWAGGTWSQVGWFRGEMFAHCDEHVGFLSTLLVLGAMFSGGCTSLTWGLGAVGCVGKVSLPSTTVSRIKLVISAFIGTVLSQFNFLHSPNIQSNPKPFSDTYLVHTLISLFGRHSDHLPESSAPLDPNGFPLSQIHMCHILTEESW